MVFGAVAFMYTSAKAAPVPASAMFEPPMRDFHQPEYPESCQPLAHIYEGADVLNAGVTPLNVPPELKAAFPEKVTAAQSIPPKPRPLLQVPGPAVICTATRTIWNVPPHAEPDEVKQGA